jgi:hypothetical protein
MWSRSSRDRWSGRRSLSSLHRGIQRRIRILVRDSPRAANTGGFASLVSDIARRVEHILGREFTARGYDPKLAPMYAQMLVGMVAFTRQWWLPVPVSATGRRPPSFPLIDSGDGLSANRLFPQMGPRGCVGERIRRLWC